MLHPKSAILTLPLFRDQQVLRLDVSVHDPGDFVAIKQPPHGIFEVLPDQLGRQRGLGLLLHDGELADVLHHDVNRIVIRLIDDLNQPDDVLMLELLHHGDFVEDGMQCGLALVDELPADFLLVKDLHGVLHFCVHVSAQVHFAITPLRPNSQRELEKQGLTRKSLGREV